MRRITLIFAMIPGLLAACGVLRAAAAETESPAVLNQSAGRAGLGLYRQDQWALVATTVTNPTSQPTEVDVVMAFGSAPHLQFARRVWLAPMSQRSIVIPVLPTHFAAKTNQTETRTFLLASTGAVDRPLGQDADGILAHADRRALAAIISADNLEASEMATSVRLAKNLPRAMAYLTVRQAPDRAIGWQAADWLILGTSDPGFNGAQMQAVRHWLVGGGQLWVMLDQVDPQFMATMLGNDWTVQLADYVDLTQVRIDGGQEDDSPARQFDDPVRLARVLSSDMQVGHTVNGWPVSLRKRIGLGRLLVTTLGPRAWVTDEPVIDKQTNQAIGLAATKALREVGDWLDGSGRAPAADASNPMRTAMAGVGGQSIPPAELAGEFDDYLEAKIGRNTIGRGVISAALGGYGLLLLLTGLWLARRGRLAAIGWAGPALALIVTALFIALRSSQLHDVPLTVAQAQLIHIVPSQHTAQVDGLHVSYSPTAVKSATLGGDDDTMVWPDMSGRGGEPVRLIWTDDGRWHWRYLNLSPDALQSAAIAHVGRLDAAVGATLTFGREGATGRFDAGPFTDLREAVIASGHGALVARLEADGSFTAAYEDALRSGQYVAALALDDDQRARQAVYRRLLQDSSYPQQPTFFVWAAPMDLDITSPEEAQHRGGALLAAPLSIQRPPAGTVVTIPSAFVPYQTARGAAGFGRSTQYAGGQWIPGIRQGAKFAMRFQLPAEVLPLELTAIHLSLDIDAAGRQVEVHAIHDDQAQPLHAWSGPQSLLTVELPADAALQPDAGGGLTLGFDIADLPSTDQRTWTIRRLDLAVSGVVR